MSTPTPPKGKVVTLDTFRVRALHFSYTTNVNADGVPVATMAGQLAYELLDGTKTPPVVLSQRTVDLVELMDADQRGRIVAQLATVVARQVAKEAMAGATIQMGTIPGDATPTAPPTVTTAETTTAKRAEG